MRALGRVMVVLGAMLVGAVLSARAAEDQGAPIAEVKATIAEASPIFGNDKLPPQEREKALRGVAAKHFDFEYMARSALGTHWKSLTAAQRQEFVPLFTDYVMDTYLGNLKDSTVEAASHALGDKVNYQAPDIASVPSVVHLPAVPIRSTSNICCARGRVAGGSTISWWITSARWPHIGINSTRHSIAAASTNWSVSSSRSPQVARAEATRRSGRHRASVEFAAGATKGARSC